MVYGKRRVSREAYALRLSPPPPRSSRVAHHERLVASGSWPPRNSPDNSRIDRHRKRPSSTQHHTCTSSPLHVHFVIADKLCVGRDDLQKLNSFTRVPDYIAYLAYILSSLPGEQDRIRTIAGYLLKNNAALILRSTPEVVEFVKAAVLQAFSDPSAMIRNAAGQDVVQFLGILEPKRWPECLTQLVALLDTEGDQQEVCLSLR